MIKYFEWGKKGGCVVATNREDAYDAMNKKFLGNIQTTEEVETCSGCVRVSFVFWKPVEPSEGTKKLLKAIA